MSPQRYKSADIELHCLGLGQENGLCVFIFPSPPAYCPCFLFPMRNLHILSTQYNQHITMISRNLSHPTIPLMSSQQYSEPLIGQHSPPNGLWLVDAECHSPSKSDHSPVPRFSSLSKKCSQGPAFYDKEINITDILLLKSLNILQRQVVHFMLGRKRADSKILQQICKICIMSDENILCLRFLKAN